MIPRRVCILTMDSIWISFFFCFSCEKPASRLLPSFLSFFCFLPWKRCQKRAQEISNRERERESKHTKTKQKLKFLHYTTTMRRRFRVVVVVVPCCCLCIACCCCCCCFPHLLLAQLICCCFCFCWLCKNETYRVHYLLCFFTLYATAATATEMAPKMQNKVKDFSYIIEWREDPAWDSIIIVIVIIYNKSVECGETVSLSNFCLRVQREEEREENEVQVGGKMVQ